MLRTAGVTEVRARIRRGVITVVILLPAMPALLDMPELPALLSLNTKAAPFCRYPGRDPGRELDPAEEI